MTHLFGTLIHSRPPCCTSIYRFHLKLLNIHMLIVYLEQFQRSQQQLLISWQQHVHYWPRSWAHTDNYNEGIPIDWWLLFSNMGCADIWLMKYPEHSRVIRTLFDEDVSHQNLQHRS